MNSQSPIHKAKVVFGALRLMAGEFIRVFKEERKRQKNVLPVRQCERDHPHEAHTWTYIEPQIDLEYICQGRDS